MKSALVHARIEPDTKRQAERVLRTLGLSPTEAIRIFYRQIALRHGLPFAVETPNKMTQTTLRKSRRGQDVQEFASVDSMVESWKR